MEDKIFRNLDEDTLDLITRDTNQRVIYEEKENIRTAGGFDMFKAMEEWAADERAEGEERARTEMVENMLRNRKTVEEIVDFCNLPEDFVRNVEKRMHVTV